MTDRSLDGRWDLHTDRQIAAAKGGVTAITILNSGSWLALLSQVGKLTGYDIGWPILFWGIGALLGTAVWLFIYRSAALQANHDFDRTDLKLKKSLDTNIYIGVGFAVASLACFAAGVLMLSWALI